MPIDILFLAADTDTARALAGAGPAVPWLRIVVAFAFCALVAAGAIFLLHRKACGTTVLDWRALLSRNRTDGTREQAPMRIVQQLPVAPGSRIVMLECEGRRYLVHLHAGGSEVLDRLETEDASS